jgi:hypothetical protein
MQRPPKPQQNLVINNSSHAHKATEPKKATPDVTKLPAGSYDNSYTTPFKLVESQLGALFAAVCEELRIQGVSVPDIAVNNHTDRWSNNMTDTTYIVLEHQHQGGQRGAP